MISLFIRKSFINHAFLYQFYQNRLKNGEVVGVKKLGKLWVFEYLQMYCNGIGHCMLCDVTQPNYVCVIEIKDLPVDNLH